MKAGEIVVLMRWAVNDDYFEVAGLIARHWNECDQQRQHGIFNLAHLARLIYGVTLTHV